MFMLLNYQPGLEPVFVAPATVVLLPAAAVGPGAPRAQRVLAPVVAAAVEQVLPRGGPRATLARRRHRAAAVIL